MTAILRRWVLTLGSALLLALVPLAVASADGGPHGDFGATTDSCAGCHRAHTAAAPNLLISNNTALCLTCHGSGATGADTNVVDGIYEGTTNGTQNAGLNGGGFYNATMDTALTGIPISGTVTSRHDVEGMPGYSATATMWGAGTSGAGTGFALDCTSCHDPHGSDNYRMLRDTINGATVAVSQTDELSKSYTSPTYYLSSGTWQISSFCAACHTRYDAKAGASGETSSGDPIFGYEHRVDAQSGTVLDGITYIFQGKALPYSSTGGAPTSGPPDNRVMVCLTCHVAHGTTATMGANSGAVSWPGGTTSPSGNARSSLLRLNNRGICENCHKK